MNSSPRRQFIKQSSLLAGVLAAGQAPQFLRADHGREAGRGVVLGHGSHRYRFNPYWAALDPVKTPVFNCHEMVMDSAGRLVMLTDETENNIIVFDRSGELIETWGHSWPGGHGLTLAPEGDEDFLFIVDCGWFFDFGRTEKWQRQQGLVVKTDMTGKIVLTIGHPLTVGAYKPGMIYQPTEVAVAPNGDFYVADGYGSQYVLHYNHRGEFIRMWGGKENEDPNYNLNGAHGVAVDNRDPDNPILIVTCRSDNLFKTFTLDGKYIDTIPMPGAFVCRPVLHGDHLYSGVCWSKENGTGKRNSDSGFVTILDGNNRVVSNPAGNAPVYEDGVLQPIHQVEKVFHHCHDVCVDNDENIYVCQWNAGKAYPYKLERV